MRPSERAWTAIGLGVIAYDVLAPPHETLSERVDDALEVSPYKRAATLGAIALVAAHLGNVIPQRYDPFHYALLWKDR